jgi:hypothetical protein
MKNVYIILVGKSERRPKSKWNNTVETNFVKVDSENVDWIHMTQGMVPGQLL